MQHWSWTYFVVLGRGILGQRAIECDSGPLRGSVSDFIWQTMEIAERNSIGFGKAVANQGTFGCLQPDTRIRYLLFRWRA